MKVEQADSRQVAKRKLRRLKRSLQDSQIHQRVGLLALIDDIKKAIRAIARAECTRREKKEKRIKREHFTKTPYVFARPSLSRVEMVCYRYPTQSWRNIYKRPVIAL